MVNPKSIENLRKGREKGVKKNRATSGGKTWADLINEYRDKPCELAPGKTWQEALVEQAMKHAMLGNAAILKEIWQRSEPQDIGVVIKKMSDVELRDYIAQQLGIAVNSD